jgi:hypothetical protein
MWSIEANFLATWKGSLKLVDAVATNPIRLVTAARAEIRVIGSIFAIY